MPYYVDKATRHPSIAYYNSPFSKLLPLISHFTETVQKCKAAPCASPLPFRASDRITGAGIRPPKSGSRAAPRNDSAALPRSDCQKTCPVTSIGGKDSVKGNRQGSLSRSITRRSDQNRKIKYCFYFAILPQLVKKVRSDFFDKLGAARKAAGGATPLPPPVFDPALTRAAG